MVFIACYHNLLLLKCEESKMRNSDRLCVIHFLLRVKPQACLNAISIGQPSTRWSKEWASLWSGTSCQSRNVSTINRYTGDGYLFCVFLVVWGISRCHVVIHLYGTAGRWDNLEPSAVDHINCRCSSFWILPLLQELWTCYRLSTLVGILLVGSAVCAN